MSLTQSQIDEAQDILDGNSVYNGKSGTEGFYEYLDSQGEDYGRLGKGVTSNNSWQGQIANGFLQMAFC